MWTVDTKKAQPGDQQVDLPPVDRGGLAVASLYAKLSRHEIDIDLSSDSQKESKVSAIPLKASEIFRFRFARFKETRLLQQDSKDGKR